MKYSAKCVGWGGCWLLSVGVLLIVASALVYKNILQNFGVTFALTDSPMCSNCRISYYSLVGGGL